MFSLFKRKPQLPAVDLSVLHTDVHSHLIPGIDDGAPTMDHSIGMLRKFEELGYRKVITTPHIMVGVYDNTAAVITEKLEELKAEATAVGLTIAIEASAEYYLDDTFLDKIRRNDLLPFAGNHILFECSFRTESQQLETAIFQLRTAGYQPVIAHFERYPYYFNRIDVAQRLRDVGALIQLNLNSLTGHYGPDVKKQGLLMIEKGLIDVVGSDCHRIEHLNLLEHHLADEPFHKLLAMELKNKSF